MKLYLYQNHLGGYYISENLYDEDDLFCDTCGDSDCLIAEGEPNELLNDCRIRKSRHIRKALLNYARNRK